MESIDQIVSLCWSELEDVRSVAREATLSFGKVPTVPCKLWAWGLGKGVLRPKKSTIAFQAHFQPLAKGWPPSWWKVQGRASVSVCSSDERVKNQDMIPPFLIHPRVHESRGQAGPHPSFFSFRGKRTLGF